jgi:aminopeptidase YwaD
MSRRLYPIVCAVLLGTAISVRAQQQDETPLSTTEELAQEFQHVPCVNKDRLPAAKGLFERMRAPADAMSVEKFSFVENLVVRHRGASQETVVIGAHYDLAERGCGAIDNWTGVVTVAHLYRIIRTLSTQKSFLFVVFGQEERGLIGSKAMVNAIGKNDIPQYCAMINIDSFGLSTPFALGNSSSKKLMALADEASKALNIPFESFPIFGADSDSSSFIARNIPAVTLSGLSSDWKSILHTPEDLPKRVKPGSVYLGYRLALKMAASLDSAPCDSYR